MRRLRYVVRINKDPDSDWGASVPFGGMERLGPGSDADTLLVLRLLSERRFSLVVDAGCGTGRQTLALAKELGVLVHAIDSHQPFLNDLTSGVSRPSAVVGCMPKSARGARYLTRRS